MNLKVLAMAIAYTSGCGTLAPDIQTKIEKAVGALSPNARVHLGQMTHRGTGLQRRSESDLGNYRPSRDKHHEKQCEVLRTRIEESIK